MIAIVTNPSPGATMHRILATLLATVALSACGNPFGCREDARTIDVVTGDGFTEVAQGIVDDYRSRGYRCDGVTLRNALGRSIGTTYTCTKC